MTTVRERIYEVLRAHRLTTMFGNPGSTELPLLENFPKDFRYILGLQEASVVAMAAGYSLVSGEASIVNLHTTAGTGNAMGAIVTAWHSQAPVIITAGQQDRRQIRTEPYLSGRQAEFVKPYVKWSAEPVRAIDVPEALERAYHVAMSEPRGPVFVSIFMDGLDEECPPVEIRRVSQRTEPDPFEIAELAEILARGKRVALIAGEQIDASGAMQDVVALAERLEASVYLAPMAHRWGFPSRHELYRGKLPAAMGLIAKRLSPFDTVLVIGAEVFLYYAYVPGDIIPQGTRVLQITNDPSMASRALSGQSIVGNITSSVKQLLEKIPESSKYVPPPPREEEMISVASAGPPPNLDYVLEQLSRVFPPNAMYFFEAPTASPYFGKYIPISEPKSHFVTASGGLGFAMPAAVGASLFATDRPIICIVGEGSAQYSIQSLWSAARHNTPVTFIVLNNEGYGILKSFGKFMGVRDVPGLEVPGVDFKGLAEGYGVDYRKASDPQETGRVVKEALDSGKPNVVEIPVDPGVPPLLG